MEHLFPTSISGFIRLADGDQMAVIMEYHGQEHVVVLWALEGRLMAVHVTGEEEAGQC